jgi:hypothetical protein
VIAHAAPNGWDVWEEEDSRIIRSARYTDWHRVERARRIMGLEMISLTELGWSEVEGPPPAR